MASFLSTNTHLEQLLGVVVNGHNVGDPEPFHLLRITRVAIAAHVQGGHHLTTWED